MASTRRIIVLSLLLVSSELSNFATEAPHVSNRRLNLRQTPQTASIVINEYLADPAGSGPGDLAGDANGDGVRDSSADEFVEIVNAGTLPVNIGLFTISDAAQVRFTVPAGKIIPPGEAAVVFGGGHPMGAFGNAAANGLVFTAGSGGLSLNNGGDTITVKDNNGVIVASVTFGSTEGNANQSITRSPDVTGGFTTHSAATGSGGSLFSPGSRVNGAPFTTTDPIIDSISPEGVVASSEPTTITVIGDNFEAGSSVRIEGASVSTMFVTASQLVAQVPTSVTNSPGVYLITVLNPTGPPSNAASFTVLSPIGINEYLADPPDGLIGDSNGDGIRDSAQDEFIEIVNRTNAPIDVGGFSIRDADAQRFVFPAGTVIPSREGAIIFGGGNPQGDFGNARANGLVFVAALSLNNSGDTITLKNASGELVESVSYGSTEGGANQSVNRDPDLAGIRFALHSAIPESGGRLFSPGTMVDGSAFTIGPRLISIAPDSARRDSAPFDMTVIGSGLEGSSLVTIDGQSVDTMFVDASQLIARVPTRVTSVSGAHQVRVKNSGGNRSNELNLTIVPPPPVLLAITPRVVLVGTGPIAIFVSGESFDAGAKVLIDGASVATSAIAQGTLSAILSKAFTAGIGSHEVLVRNGDGQKSSSAQLEVIAPALTISSVTPRTAIADGSNVSLSIKGTNFKAGVTALFDRLGIETTFKSATELAAVVPSPLLAIGIHAISARDTDSSISNEMAFQMLPDPPLISSLDPGSVIEDRGELPITIKGEKFQEGAIVRLVEPTQRGVSLSTIFVSGELLKATIPATLTRVAGEVALAVENPDSGLSNIASLKILIKDPLVINEILADPPEGPAGDANGDGVRSSSSDEFVEILNRSAESIDISRYMLSDADAIRHVFAAGTIVPPFEAVVVFGGGTPRGSFGNAAENHLVFKASSGGLSLNNGGDTVKLADAEGRVLQEVKFSSAEGGTGQSINRDPDGDGSTFALHSIVASNTASLYSPGSKANGQTFTIKPRVSSISPPEIRAGSSSDIAIEILGSKFMPAAVVLIDNAEVPTNYRSDTRLKAQLNKDLIADGGLLEVRVKNPRGELSAPAILIVVDDPPTLSRVTPSTIGTGSDAAEIAIEGARFQHGASVKIGGTAVETKFTSVNLLRAIVPSVMFSRAANLPVAVHNADGNDSNVLKLSVDNGPLITRLSPNKVRSGSESFDLSVGGVAFKPGVVLFANEIALETLFVSEISLRTRIPAEMLREPGVVNLQARNPDGGKSNAMKLKVR
jgi:hypothetical protein